MFRLYKNFFIVVFILLSALNFKAQAQPQFFAENPLIGEKAPDFTLKNLEGQNVSLSSFREGKSTIVFFWATWCPHCREQLKKLSAMESELTQKNIKVALVDIGEEKRQVGAFVEKNKIAFNVFLDQDSAVSETYNIIGVPTFFFINQEGVVQAVEHFLPENFVEKLVKK